MDPSGADPDAGSAESGAARFLHFGAEELDCAGPYDAERTAGSVQWGALVLALPHGWTRDEAIRAPLDVEWHEPVVRWMLSERIAEPDEIQSYFMRQSILVWQTYAEAEWSESCRKGTAYTLLLVGLESHGFRPSSDRAYARERSFVLDPPSDFFERLTLEGGIPAMARLLRAAFVHSSSD